LRFQRLPKFKKIETLLATVTGVELKAAAKAVAHI
jgi:hypothetical protein